MRGCSFLLSTLPALANLPHLRVLKFSIQDCTATQVESALLLTAVAARGLERLVACDVKDRGMAATVRQRVRRGLQAHGVEGVRVVLPDNWASDDDED